MIRLLAAPLPILFVAVLAFGADPTLPRRSNPPNW